MHILKYKQTSKKTYFNASALDEIFTDVSAIVFNRVLIDKLLAHDWTFFLETLLALYFLQDYEYAI